MVVYSFISTCLVSEWVLTTLSNVTVSYVHTFLISRQKWKSNQCIKSHKEKTYFNHKIRKTFTVILEVKFKTVIKLYVPFENSKTDVMDMDIKKKIFHPSRNFVLLSFLIPPCIWIPYVPVVGSFRRSGWVFLFFAILCL